MTRLSLATVPPGYLRTPLQHDRGQTGIVHLGIGAFHRAHQAVMTEDAMIADGDFGWGITGVTQRSDTVIEQLRPQDGLYSLTERGAGAAPLRIISSVHDVIAGHREPERAVHLMGAASTSVISLTITEKGYRIDPRTGGLNLADPHVQADLAGHPPQTAVGQLVRGIQRRIGEAGPVTILSCDNLPGNGALTKRLVHDFISHLPAAEGNALVSWLEANSSFPGTMVDRMVPATTASDREQVMRQLGVRDDGAVVAEPFLQWVIEDDFAGRRPRWEAAGAQLTTDVEAWESAKLRLLNASHSMLAYLGLATGLQSISEAVAEESFHTACRRMMAEDVLPTLRPPAGLDLDQYCASVLLRFANPALGHTTAQVGNDGSQKLAPRLLGTIRDSLAAGRIPRWASLAVAAWMHRVYHADAISLNDPLASRLKAALPATGEPAAVVSALLRFDSVFDEGLASDQGFASALTQWYRIIDNHGLAGLRNEINHA